MKRCAATASVRAEMRPAVAKASPSAPSSGNHGRQPAHRGDGGRPDARRTSERQDDPAIRPDRPPATRVGDRRGREAAAARSIPMPGRGGGGAGAETTSFNGDGAGSGAGAGVAPRASTSSATARASARARCSGARAPTATLEARRAPDSVTSMAATVPRAANRDVFGRRPRRSSLAQENVDLQANQRRQAQTQFVRTVPDQDVWARITRRRLGAGRGPQRGDEDRGRRRHPCLISAAMRARGGASPPAVHLADTHARRSRPDAQPGRCHRGRRPLLPRAPARPRPAEVRGHVVWTRANISMAWRVRPRPLSVRPRVNAASGARSSRPWSRRMRCR